jgi:cytochrome c biogenesis protein CcmG, thiol:disulfide interchange protein DsbE
MPGRSPAGRQETKVRRFCLRTPAAALASAALVLGVAGCSGRSGPGAASATESDHSLLGASAPEFELDAKAGDKGAVSLAEGQGKVVIVDFWATWCEPCKESFPAYQRLLDKFEGKLVIIGVSVDETPDGIAAFASETGVKFPLVWDEGQALSQKYQPPTMPTSYVIDKSGIVRFVHAGFTSGDEARIESDIASLVN